MRLSVALVLITHIKNCSCTTQCRLVSSVVVSVVPLPFLDSAPELALKDTHEGRFKVGMKLEAVDRRFPYFVCVSTIMDRSGENLCVMWL